MLAAAVIAAIILLAIILTVGGSALIAIGLIELFDGCSHLTTSNCLGLILVGFVVIFLGLTVAA